MAYAFVSAAVASGRTVQGIRKALSEKKEYGKQKCRSGISDMLICVAAYPADGRENHFMSAHDHT
jgi:hypothetical protein